MSKKIILTISIIIISSFLFKNAFKDQKKIVSTIDGITDFSLLDQKGVFHSLYRHADAKAIVIIAQGNDCPEIQKYSEDIRKLKKKYESENIVFYLLNSNRQDSRESIIEESLKYNFELPILIDPSQLIAELLGITRTTEAVVISPDNWKIIYRGAISDRIDYGVDKKTAKNNYLDDVLSAILNNTQIPNEIMAPAKGCFSTFQKPKNLSYNKTIAPIIINKCLNCHTQKMGYLPYFTNYEKVKNWATMIKNTILTERMPPWSSDPLVGNYENDISLTPDEKRVLVKWIEGGAQFDGKIDPIISANQKINEKKNSILKNDKLLFSTNYTQKDIPAEGMSEYIYAQLGDAAPYDMWVTAHETQTTNPRQIHHEALMVTSKPLAFYEKLVADNLKKNFITRIKNINGEIPLYVLMAIAKYERINWPLNYTRFQGWGGGIQQPVWFRKKGITLFIPKGSYLILENHYMGTGKVEDETSTFNFYGVKSKPKNLKQMRSYPISNFTFEIPSMVKNFEVQTPEWIPNEDVEVLGYTAHLHMRGKSVITTITNPNGETKIFSSIPNFNYAWGIGTFMEFKKPILVKKGSILKSVCSYDNSPTNPNNPDPTKIIKFGQRVDTNEMCIMRFTYTKID